MEVCGAGEPHAPTCPAAGPAVGRSLTRLPWVRLLLSQMKETMMNQEKLAKLQAQVRIGGKVGAASPPSPPDCVSLQAHQA